MTGSVSGSALNQCGSETLPATSYSFCSSVTEMYTVKEKGGKPETSRTLKICPETSTKLYVHEFGFRFQALSV
jgi:hypothetical protein